MALLLVAHLRAGNCHGDAAVHAPVPWCVVRGAWCVVRGAWCVVRGAWCVVRGAWCVVRGACCVTRAPPLPCSPTATLPHSHTPTLPHSHTPTLPHSHTPTLPYSHTPTLPHSHTPTLPHSHTPTLPHSHTPTLPHSHTPTLPHSHTPTLRSLRLQVVCEPRDPPSTLAWQGRTISARRDLIADHGGAGGRGLVPLNLDLHVHGARADRVSGINQHHVTLPDSVATVSSERHRSRCRACVWRRRSRHRAPTGSSTRRCPGTPRSGLPT